MEVGVHYYFYCYSIMLLFLVTLGLLALISSEHDRFDAEDPL